MVIEKTRQKIDSDKTRYYTIYTGQDDILYIPDKKIYYIYRTRRYHKTIQHNRQDNTRQKDTRRQGNQIINFFFLLCIS
jgi:hypothetical protein